jgi:uncharacterized protein DUF1566
MKLLSLLSAMVALASAAAGCHEATAACTNACAAVGTHCGSSTSLQTCSLAENGCTVLTTSNCPTGLVCERLTPTACVDPSWAEWPMPNGPTDVAAGAPNAESYIDNGDDTVTDTVTGLIWQTAAAPGTFTQAQAVAFCPTLTLGTHDDWRLPTVIELASISDLAQANPSIDITSFPATPAAIFWSSSAAASQQSAAWFVSFVDGMSSFAEVSKLYDVRCVR